MVVRGVDESLLLLLSLCLDLLLLRPDRVLALLVLVEVALGGEALGADAAVERLSGRPVATSHLREEEEESVIDRLRTLTPLFAITYCTSDNWGAFTCSLSSVDLHHTHFFFSFFLECFKCNSTQEQHIILLSTQQEERERQIPC